MKCRRPSGEDRRASSGRILRHAILLATAVLAGCGASGPPTSPSPASPASIAPATMPAAPAASSPSPRTPVAATASPLPAADTYVVVAGDTLWKIAQRYGRTVDELFAANPQLTDRALVRPGDTIAIPSDALHAIWKAMVTGRDAVSRDEITMSGTVVDVGPGTLGDDGLVRFSVRLTGLSPGEAVTLSAVGRSEITWACRELPVGTGPVPDVRTDGSDWTVTQHLGGTARAATRAVAGIDGSASLVIDLVPAHPVAGTCPDPRSPWYRLGTSWEPVTITDAAHGLRLTPEPVVTGP